MFNVTSYFLFFNFNYICSIYVFLNLLRNEYKIKSITEALTFFLKNNIFYLFLFILFNLIGLPPMPTFFLKLSMFFIFLQKYNVYTYICIILFNISIFFFYTNYLNFFNLNIKSKKYFYFFIYPIIYVLSLIIMHMMTSFFFLNIFTNICII